MKTKTEDRGAAGGGRRSPLGRGVLLVLLGGILGAAAAVGARPEPAPAFPGALFGQDIEQVGGNTEGEYIFFTFRRNLWVVHRPTGSLQFLMFPDGQEQPLVRSRVHAVDPAIFPPDQTRYQLSERNLTNFLWVLNPITAKAQFVRAGRDGALEFSEVESVHHKE